MKKILIVVLLFCFGRVYAQDKKIDSLINLLKTTKSDTEKVCIQSDLLNFYAQYNDSTSFYKTYQQAYQLAEKINYPEGKIVLLNRLAHFYVLNSSVVKSKNALIKAEDIASKINNKSYLAKVYYEYSVLYKSSDNYATALSYNFKSLKISESQKDTVAIANCYGQIANIYRKQKDFLKANEFYKKAYQFDSLTKDEDNIAVSLSNIGLSYGDLKDFDNAIFYLKKSLLLKRKRLNLRGVSNTLNILGAVYVDWKKPKEALQYISEALEIKRKIKDEKGVAISLVNIGQLYESENDFKKAIPYLIECVETAKKIRNNDILIEAYLSLSKCYNGTNNPLAYQTHVLYSNLKDSIYNMISQKELHNMQTKYGSEKKEAENKLLQTENELSGKTIKQQKIINYFIVGGLVLALLFAFFIFRGLKAQRRANKIISKQKEEVHHQKEIVEEKQKEILDSIHYAKRIQRAVITSDTYISEHVKDYFIYYQPKDIVSGDFYWALHVNNKFYLATADCTGHGVPGAFMSLLNISILNEVMIEKKIARADLILNEARKDIIKSLNPTGSEESKDGMDCILACFDFENLKLEYAAANNSFYIIRNNELIICKADKMPVGKSPRDEEPFTLHTVDLQKGDTVYMLTDGLPDQFGGEKGKKFKYKQLEDLLMANTKKSLAEQKEILNTSFHNWKGNLEQVDDVLLIGIKI